MSIIDWMSQAAIQFCTGAPPVTDQPLPAGTLDWMEQSALGVCVAQSPAGYYIALAFHSLGLAIIVGAVTVIDLRLLGAVRGIAADAMSKIVRFAWWGLGVNALSGVAIFFSEANKAFYSVSFRIKMALMICAVISTIILNKKVLRPAAEIHSQEFPIAGGAKAQAVLSLCLWASVIIVGRMMSYLTEFTST